MSSLKLTNTKRNLFRAIALLWILMASLALGAVPANAATCTWTASCGSGDYYHTGALGSSARALQAHSQCGVKARVYCQRQTGALQWQAASTWKFLDEVSTKYCASPYDHARPNISYYVGG